LILRHLRESGEQQIGRAVSRAVLTHPVSYGPEQQQALTQAARIAGWDVAALISEPLAGALASGHGQHQSEVIAIYDFGGGTFDFSVLQLSPHEYRLLASAGDSWLGGDDFDIALAEAVANAFWHETKVELQKRAVEWQRLVLACERAKRRLSADEHSLIDLPNLIQAEQPLHLNQRIDRATLQRICTPLFERSVQVCRQALHSAGLGHGQIDHVVLIGGITRIPFVRNQLARFFERPMSETVSPDDAVALGAGVYAARLVGHPVRQVHSWAT
jgi:molecular chaperone DnaK